MKRSEPPTASSVEFKVWQIPKSVDYPKGVKYSFFAVRSGTVLVGYDNHRPKGHHRHCAGEAGRYDFDGFDKLRPRFRKARLAKRDFKHVHGDVALLQDLGLVHATANKQGKPTRLTSDTSEIVLKIAV